MTSTRTTYDLLIIGGGIVGLAAAYRAGQLGARTLLLDRHDAGRATDAGAGILSPETATRDGQIWYEFGMAAVRYYPALLGALNADGLADTGIDSGYSPCPKLLVALSEDELPAFEESKQVILQRQDARGDGGANPIRPISSAEARDLLPPLAEAAAVLYQPHAARVDGRMISAALRWGLDRQGVVQQTADVRTLQKEGARVIGVEDTRGERYRAAAVLIAGGAWSPAFGHQLGVQIPVEPQRGQIIHLDLGGTDTRGWPIVNGFRGHYLVPWPDSRVAVGATRETGSGYDPRTTAIGVREVIDTALQTAPGLAHAAIREIRVGLRPYTHDHLPVLGEVPGYAGIYLATGHGPTGLQLGPYSGKLVAEMALGRPIEYDIAPFSIRRFEAKQG